MHIHFFLFASHSNPILIFLFHSIVLQSYCDFILILFSVFNSVFIRILFKFYLHYVLILIKFYLRHVLQNVYQRACRLLRACTALHKPPATKRSAHIRTASRAPKRVPAPQCHARLGLPAWLEAARQWRTWLHIRQPHLSPQYGPWEHWGLTSPGRGTPQSRRWRPPPVCRRTPCGTSSIGRLAWAVRKPASRKSGQPLSACLRSSTAAHIWSRHSIVRQPCIEPLAAPIPFRISHAQHSRRGSRGRAHMKWLRMAARCMRADLREPPGTIREPLGSL